MAIHLCNKSLPRILSHFNNKRLTFSRMKMSYLITQLSSRQLLRASGNHAYQYMQGMITNDMRHLEDNNETSVNLNIIWAFILNHLGRLMYDLCIYKGRDTEHNELFLEADSTLIDNVLKHLNMYRVKRAVQFKRFNNVTPFVLFPETLNDDDSQNDIKFDMINDMNQLKSDDSMMIMRDPRLKDMGFRILTFGNLQSKDEIIKLLSSGINIKDGTLNDYVKHRYTLGVGEGIDDHPLESCFPLECNADFLHGVSFHKGCYVGQELTARIHHTGVIRKRLMPIKILCDDNQINELNLSNTNVVNSEGKSVGKLRSHLGTNGLALLRVEEAMKGTKLLLSDTNYEIKTWRPQWWPKELNKEDSGRATH